MPVYSLPAGSFDLLTPLIMADFPQILRNVNERASLVVQREARSNALEFRDTGALARSIQARVTDMVVVVSVPSNQPTAAYANVMELGRRAHAENGGVNAHMPPPDVLQGWMSRHGIPVNMAFVVSRAINRRGITGRLFMQRAVDSLGQQMPGIINTVMRQMGIA
jgi:hypothetical protein